MSDPNETVKDVDVNKFFADEERKRKESESRAMVEIMMVALLMDGAYQQFARLMKRVQVRLPRTSDDTKSLSDIVRREDLDDLRALSKAVTDANEAILKTIAAVEIR